MINTDTASTKQNAIILSNASALVAAVVSNMREQHVSKTINQESLTRDRIEHLVASRLNTCLMNRE